MSKLRCALIVERNAIVGNMLKNGRQKKYVEDRSSDRIWKIPFYIKGRKMKKKKWAKPTRSQ